MEKAINKPKSRIRLTILLEVVAAAAAVLTLLATTTGCGRAPSRLLRQGQLPIYDFPLFVSEGAGGRVWKYSADQSRSLVLEGLSEPRGLATDRFNNLYVVEQGRNRLLKVNVSTGVQSVVAENLATPSVVAVNSVGEPFVAQDAGLNIVRATDGKVFATYSSRPTALAFGVGDAMFVGLFDMDQVIWGVGGATTAVTRPVGISTDSTGRAYVAEGSDTGAKVRRYRQSGGEGETVVADSLVGPQGLAVDSVGNLYLVEQGASRIVLVSHDGNLFEWVAGLVDPQYLAFTQY